MPQRIPRRIPDEKFDELFAALRYDRDRALLALWVSTGARAQELLDLPAGGRRSGAADRRGAAEGERRGPDAACVAGRVRVAAPATRRSCGV
ncbi:hypothetical protein ACU686_13030 [Yinghuangia aomiensis]